MKVLVCTTDASDNGVGRVQRLWSAAQLLGHEFVVAHARGDLWQPLQNSQFAEHCLRHAGSDDRTLLALARDADVIVAHKPFKHSFGLALELRRATGTPIVVDIDDPDVEVRLGTARGVAKTFVKSTVRADGTVRELRRLRRQARSVVRITPNPVLQQRWGGVVVPHISDASAGSAHQSSAPQIAFIGTIQKHKGVDLLRQAVARLAPSGFTLVVTGRRPSDARPWEQWVESNTWAEGQAMQAACDIVAIPSRRTAISASQLPAKACDAMLSGRAIVATDVGPLRWAVGDCGKLVPPGDVDALTDALRQLQSPATRAEFGMKARRRAQELFSVDAVAPKLDEALHEAAKQKLG